MKNLVTVPKKRKILIVAPSLNVGGIGRHLSVFAECFAEMGHNILFISCINEKAFYTLHHDILIKKPSFNRGKSSLKRLIFYPRLIKFLHNEIISYKPDWILVFGDIINPLVLLAVKGTKFPVFIGDMTSPDYDHGIVIKLLKSWLYPSSTGVISQTHFANKHKIKQFGDKLNTIVLDNPIRKIKNHNIPKEKVILYVGRFSWEKAPHRLIEAFAKLNDAHEWKLVFAGSGPLLEEVKSMVIEMNLQKNVDFLGKVKDVDRLYSLASIYVLPSVVEGFPNALCEAMIAGLPCICFDDWPSNEIISNSKNGFIVSSIEELSQRLKILMENEDLRKKIGDKARDIKSRLDKNIITEKLEQFMSISTQN
jgi:GalNAc-alpha-(1->4)-GalNAc-alpha-(1->3)-diNAcBac-PP-undecaprenol alpha-1,4-N-acetyl-D-galactosaminyltransferase